MPKLLEYLAKCYGIGVGLNGGEIFEPDTAICGYRWRVRCILDNKSLIFFLTSPFNTLL